MVASILMAMGMMMVSPVTIALPFKLMLFVLVDGWTLLLGSLVQSFTSVSEDRHDSGIRHQSGAKRLVHADCGVRADYGGGAAGGFAGQRAAGSHQINEMTLTFIPKLLAMFVVLVVAGPWMINTLMDYTIRLFTSIPNAVG